MFADCKRQTLRSLVFIYSNLVLNYVLRHTENLSLFKYTIGYLIVSIFIENALTYLEHTFEDFETYEPYFTPELPSVLLLSIKGNGKQFFNKGQYIDNVIFLLVD